MFAAITTCKRPNGESYLHETRKSLISAGFDPHLISDGQIGCSWDASVRLGIVPTFRLAVRDQYNNSDKQHPVVIFQDDIEPSSCMMTFSFTTEDGTDIQQRMKPSESLAVIIEKCLPAKRGVFSLYLTEGRDAPQGWSTIDKSDTYPLNVGACGIVMDAETARLFIDSPPFPRVDRLGSQLVLWCWENGIPFWIHSPSLLVHTGKVSCRL